MKKTYINPITKIVKIELTNMIAISTLGTTNATSGNLSRGDYDYESDWDDE